MTTVLCNRSGCGTRFSPDSPRQEGECSFHDGSPVFHEGLKSWSCCKDVNKPVMEFDQFQRIPGCTRSTHLVKASAPPPSKKPDASEAAPAPTSVSSTGVESYGAAPAVPAPSTSSAHEAASVVAAATAAATGEKKEEEEQDEEGVDIPVGSICKRRGCGRSHAKEGEGEGDRDCVHHPGLPVFREGSKGYTCCKRRVLEFDEFLKLPGCRTSKHLFIGRQTASSSVAAERELVPSRVDFYQTVKEVHVSVFAKGSDKQLSTVVFKDQAIELDLYLPSNKRTLKTISLYGPIDPARSTFSILGTKVAITLAKADGKSWPILEVSAGVTLPPGYAISFGVGGRTGTVGGKEAVLAPEQGH